MNLPAQVTRQLGVAKQSNWETQSAFKPFKHHKNLNKSFTEDSKATDTCTLETEQKKSADSNQAQQLFEFFKPAEIRPLAQINKQRLKFEILEPKSEVAQLSKRLNSFELSNEKDWAVNKQDSIWKHNINLQVKNGQPFMSPYSGNNANESTLFTTNKVLKDFKFSGANV